MKRILFTIVLASVAAVLALPLAAVADETEVCTYTMQVVFKEQFEMPEGLGYMYFADDPNDPDDSLYYDNVSDSNNLMTYTHTVEKGHQLTAEEIPHFYIPQNFQIAGCSWDVQPVIGMPINEDCTFTYTIDNTGTVPVVFSAATRPDALAEDGLELDAYHAPWGTRYSLALVKPGYTLTEEDLPNRHIDITPGTYNTILNDDGWDTDPVGFTVNEPCEFKHYFNRMFCVDFVYPGATTVPHTFYVEPGGDVVPPEVPKVHNERAFFGWNGSYTNVTYSRLLIALYTAMGDTNQDDTVNTSDAVLLLKYAAGITELEDISLFAAETNRDGAVNTSDAVEILKYCAGIIEELPLPEA